MERVLSALHAERDIAARLAQAVGPTQAEPSASPEQATAPGRNAALPRRVPGSSNGPTPPGRIRRQHLSAAFTGGWLDSIEETLPRAAASGLAPSDTGSPARDAISVQPNPTQPDQAESDHAESDRAEPDRAEPDRAEPDDAEPDHPRPRPPESERAQPDHSQSDGITDEGADHWPVSAAKAAPQRPPSQPAERQDDGGQLRTGPAHRIARALTAVGVLIAAGSLAFALFWHTAAPAEHKASGAGPNTVGAGPSTRDLAAAWVASQVSRTGIVSCDPRMCLALLAQGFPPDHLLRLTRGRGDPLRSDVIVATAAVRGQFGGRLRSVYAPAVIASFGSGRMRINVRAIAKHGAAAYEAAFRADRWERKTSGAQLLLSDRIAVSAKARTQLSAGQVDSRLLITIADLAARNPIFIVAFSDSGPGASTGSPLRSADVANASPPARSDPTLVRSLLAFLRADGARFPPTHMHIVRLGDGQTVLRLEFAAPSPLGLLGPGSR